MSTLNLLERKTVLVTGATGFIGAHLVRRLSQNPAIHLVLLTRKPMVESRDGITCIAAALDQLTKKTWQAAGIEKIDVVLHLAAFIPKSNDAINAVEQVYRDNLLGTRSLLESLPTPPQRIVFASTIDVYAALPDGVALSESSPIEPASLYGASKLFCEQLIRTYARQQDCNYAILRYGHIFGSGEAAYKKLIPQTIQRLLQGKAPILYGDGSAERDFLYVEDAVEATLRAATSEIQQISPLNIVRGESSSIRSIIETLIQLTEFSGTIQYLADKPVGNSLRFDSSKMQDILGKWKLISLEEGLKNEVEYFRNLIP
ncbi:NAD(P)-dependent oxidoreductase [Lyngbya sp. CCAP 1446/10]|uniref:NAD-dependent epimerase/dehydratase family protein n=1 Tax=Lyngbya sp. CCAP 1446/10 TaxID=439293 RepID=UPI002237E8A6|nr:NAD(P)-dependent oxidoreductase [Lyngbya sp. CCAP 1446/10]MCW6050393.1 NAD(P)-dependent oxidoreductase [Lyngbya sp. CCAP 1446/10]